MSIVQVKGSGGSVATDRSPFYGARIPQDIKSVVKLMTKIDKQTFRKVLQSKIKVAKEKLQQEIHLFIAQGLTTVIVSSMEGKDVCVSQLKELESDTFNEESLCVLYTGLHSLLRCALRLPLTSLKPEMFKEDLQELHIPEEFHSDLSSVVFGARRPQIDSHSLDNRPRLPGLDCLKWRVDVGISTSALNRVLEPCILMEMKLSDGKIHTFEVPVAKFHELRYNVAFVLKEMEDLEKRSILKIQD